MSASRDPHSPSEGDNGGATHGPQRHGHGDETVFVDSTTGLRDVAVDQGQPAWLRILRYVPLVLMVCLAVIATAIGVWYVRTHPTAVAPQSGTQSQAQSRSVTEAPSAPQICAKTVAAPEPGLWDASDASSAEAAFTEGTKGTGAWIDGRNGFRFWGDAFNANISQAVGRVHVDTQQMTAWAEYISRVSAAAQKNGARFLVMVAPAKWDIYPEDLPAWTDSLTGATSRVRLMSAHPELPWVDVRDALVSERTTHPDVPLYARANSHWSPYGAWVAWNRTLDCLSALDGSLGDLSRQDSTGVTSQAAPDEFAALGATSTSTKDWTLPIYAKDLGSVRVDYLQTNKTESIPLAQGLDFADLPATTTNDGAPDHTLLVARDSMGNSMSTGMMSSFRRTIQVRNGFDVNEPSDLPTLIGLYKPDVVILEFAERYLVQTPR